MDSFSNPSRTWMCSILFLDIVNYSSQSVQLQMEWKRRFNDYLQQSLSGLLEAERVILDTGDGAAICFLGPIAPHDPGGQPETWQLSRPVL